MSAPHQSSNFAVLAIAALGLALTTVASLAYAGMRRVTRDDRLYIELATLAREPLRLRVIVVTIRKPGIADNVNIRVLPLNEVEAEFGMIANDHESPTAE